NGTRSVAWPAAPSQTHACPDSPGSHHAGGGLSSRSRRTPRARPRPPGGAGRRAGTARARRSGSSGAPSDRLTRAPVLANLPGRMGVERVKANGLTIAYETLGDPAEVPLVLVAGLGRQLIGWPDGFLRALVERGHLVVRFDNRDVGESTHLHDAPQPDLRACLAGDASSAPYSLSDMAADVGGLLDALGIESA